MVNMWRPITITSITTISGFLAVSASSYMPPMTYFGLFGALGVFAALVYAVMFIPSALMLVKPQISKAYTSSDNVDRFGKIMEVIGAFVVKYPKLILGIAVIIIAFGVHGASKLEINEDRIQNFQSTEQEGCSTQSSAVSERTDNVSSTLDADVNNSVAEASCT